MVSVEASPGRHQGNTGAVRGEDKEDTRTKTGHPEVQQRVPIGAWKFNIQPFQEIRTDRLTDQPTDMRSHREVIPQIRESSLIKGGSCKQSSNIDGTKSPLSTAVIFYHPRIILSRKYRFYEQERL